MAVPPDTTPTPLTPREGEIRSAEPPAPARGEAGQAARGSWWLWWGRTAARLAALILLCAGFAVVSKLDRANHQLRTEGDELRTSLARAETTTASVAAQKQEIARSFQKAVAELRDAGATRDAHLVTSQLMRVAGLYKTDPLTALALLHDYEALAIDRRDAAWHFYANCCERRLRPERLGRVIAASIHGRRHNVYPVSHRDAQGRVLALVEAPDGKWTVTDLASGETVRAAHPDLPKRGEVHSLSIDGRTAGVWTKGKEVKNEETGKVEAPSEYGFVDVETGRWHKLRLRTARGLLTPDGTRFVIHNDAERAVYDVATGEDVGKAAYGEEFDRVESTSAVSADGKYLASFVRSDKAPGVVRIVDARTNKDVATVAPPKRQIELHGKTHPITGPEAKLVVALLQFSPDGKKLAVVYRYYGKISIPEHYDECHVVSVPDGARIGVHGVSNAEFPTYVAFSRDGSLLAVACGLISGVGGSRGTLGVYRTDPGKGGDFLLPVVHQYAWPVPPAGAGRRSDSGLVRGLSFAPDGSRVAVAVQTDGGYHAVEADVRSGRLRRLPGSLPHEFGRENVDANVHISVRNELLVVSEFGTLHRWHLDPDDAVATLPHTSPHSELRHDETRIAFARSGSRLFVRDWYAHWHNGKERIENPPAELALKWERWNAQAYARIRSLEPPDWKPNGLTDQTPAAAAFPENESPSQPVSPDGRTGAAVSADGAIELWDVNTKRLRASLESHGHPVRAVRFSPDGRALASLDAAHVVKVWDFGAPALHAQWQGTAAAFSPDEETVAVGGHRIDRSPLMDDEAVTFFNPRTGRGNHLIYRGKPRRLEYSTDGRVLAVGDALFARDAEGWKEVDLDVPTRLSGTNRVFLPEAKMVVMLFSDLTGIHLPIKPEQAVIKRGGADSGPVTALLGRVTDRADRFEPYKYAIGYRPGNKAVVVVQPGLANLAISYYDQTNGKRTESRTVSLKTPVERLWAVLPGGEGVVATDRTTGEFVKHTVSLQVIDLATGAAQSLPGDHTGGLADVAASPDGRWFASGDGLGVVRVWDLHDRRLVKKFWARGNGVGSLTFSPSGRYIAVAGDDGWVRVWDVAVLGRDE